MLININKFQTFTYTKSIKPVHTLQQSFFIFLKFEVLQKY